MSSAAWADSDAVGSAGLTRLTSVLLAITIFSGGFVFMEPSPYEVVFSFLCLAVLIRGTWFPRLLSIPVVLLAFWLVGGTLSLAANGSDMRTITYMAVSAYLAISTIIFAALCAERPEKITSTIRRAYLAAAMIAALAGIAGYFHLFPGSDMFAQFSRARGMFKDPNVFAPFLILPALLLVQDIISSPKRRLALSGAMLTTILAAILLSFSRASWGHLLLSGVLMAGLMFVTSGSNLLRLRIIGSGVLGLCLAGTLIAVLLAIPSVSEIFMARAELVQDYDAGATGRFGAQLRSLTEILEHPLGFGPYGFSMRFGQDAHNVYLNGFSSYGWLGGFAYLAFVVSTWLVGSRCALITSPWQNFQIAAFATYFGVSLEGIVIDTDHWRHYFLLAGIVWGLSAATLDYRARYSYRS